MNRIIEKLDQIISKLGLIVLDKRNDGFTYVISVRSKNTVFVVYTTRAIFHFREHCCLRMFELSKHIPVDTVEPWPGGDFIMPYTQAITRSGKLVTYYDRSFTLEEMSQKLKI